MSSLFRTRLAGVLAASALLLVVSWVDGTGTAEAHATLVRSDPPVNARLLEPPTVVTAFFSESLDEGLSSIKVFDGSGKQVDTGDVSLGPEPGQMSVAVKDLQPSFYSVEWETLSTVDGHLLDGSFPFTILKPDGTEPEGPRPSAEGGADFKFSDAKPEDVATKWINILGAVLLVGGVGFALSVAGPAARSLPPPTRGEVLAVRRRHVTWAVLVGVVLLGASGLAELLLQANKLGGTNFIDEALGTGWGEHWVQRQALLAIIAAVFAGFLASGHRSGVLGEAGLFATFCGGVLYLLVVALVSHGASIPGSFWATAIDFSHLLAGAVWIGMLIQLGLLMAWARHRPSGEDRDAILLGHLCRFSPFAATSVVVLLASGTGNALGELPDLSALTDTVYGRVLLIKLGVIVATLLVAGFNAFFVRPRLVARSESGSPAAETLKRLLWRTVRIEIGLGLIVFLISAALIQYPTGRQQHTAEENVKASQEAAGSFNGLETVGGIDVQLSISPNQVGTNAYLLYVYPPSRGEPVEISRVRLRFQSPDPARGPSEVIADETEPNSYKAIGPFFTEPGEWRVQVELRRVQADDLTADFSVGVTGTAATEEGGKYTFPLQAGSWASASVVLAGLGIIIVLVWMAQWPPIRLPRRPSA
jgi:copper transport protein